MTPPEQAPPPAATPPVPLPAGLTQATAQANGMSLHYARGGSGLPVVPLHGFPQTWYEWHRLFPPLFCNSLAIKLN